MKYELKSIDFEGPLDLLLELVKSNKCEIKDIFIKNIIDQYLEIIQDFRGDNCEIASEFILMASTLIEMKSRYFIYINDFSQEEEDPGTDLYKLLEEYKIYKEKAIMLGEMYKESPMLYSNKGTEILVDEFVDFSAHTIIDLFAIFTKLFKESNEPQPRTNMVSYKKISVEEKILKIEQIMEQMSKFYFESITDTKTREDVVASLLGALELSKEQRILLSQEKIFDDILIERVGDGN